MLKRIAVLAMLFLVREAPASADWTGDLNLQAAAVEEADPRQTPASVRDCERRFGSLRARSEMRPSERERALEACLELARNRVADQRLAISKD